MKSLQSYEKISNPNSIWSLSLECYIKLRDKLLYYLRLWLIDLFPLPKMRSEERDEESCPCQWNKAEKFLIGTFIVSQSFSRSTLAFKYIFMFGLWGWFSDVILALSCDIRYGFFVFSFFLNGCAKTRFFLCASLWFHTGLKSQQSTWGSIIVVAWKMLRSACIYGQNVIWWDIKPLPSSTPPLTWKIKVI